MNAASGLGKYSNLGCNIYWYSMQKGGVYYIPYALSLYISAEIHMNPGIIRHHLLRKINAILSTGHQLPFLVLASITWGYVLLSVHVLPPRGQASRVV